MSQARAITFTVGSVFESTPEGLHHMDRLREAEEARRSALEPWERDLEDAVNREIDRAVFGL